MLSIETMSNMKLPEFLIYFYDKYGKATEPYESSKVGQPGYPKRQLEVIDLYFLQSYIPCDNEDEREWITFTTSLKNYCGHELHIH